MARDPDPDDIVTSFLRREFRILAPAIGRTYVNDVIAWALRQPDSRAAAQAAIASFIGGHPNPWNAVLELMGALP